MLNFLISSKCSNFAFFNTLPISGKCLDLGAGRGELVSLLRANGVDCIGCDIKEWYSTNPSDSVEGLEVGVHLFQSTAHNIPFGDQTFDSIVSNQVFEHIADLPAMISELYRVTKPNSYLYLLFPTSSLLYEPHTLIPFFHRVKPYSFFSKFLFYISYLLKNKRLNGSRLSYPYEMKYVDEQVFLRSLEQISTAFNAQGFNVEDLTTLYLNQRFQFGLPLSLISKFIDLKIFFPVFLKISR